MRLVHCFTLTLRPVTNTKVFYIIIKIFNIQAPRYNYKLDFLSLVSIYSLIKYLWVTMGAKIQNRKLVLSASGIKLDYKWSQDAQHSSLLFISNSTQKISCNIAQQRSKLELHSMYWPPEANFIIFLWP